MPQPPRLSLLVQSPGPEGRGLLLEDLRSGRQRCFATPQDLLRAVAASLSSERLPAGDPHAAPPPDQ